MSETTAYQPREFFIGRTYPGGIISSGGPYPTREEANRAARRFRPANARTVEVRDERLDPMPRSGRHLVLRMRQKDVPGRSVLVGPFVSRREARNFLRSAATPLPCAGSVPASPLGDLAHDWEPIEANRSADLDANAWAPEPRLSF